MKHGAPNMIYADVLHYLQHKLKTSARPNTPLPPFPLLSVQITQNFQHLLPYHSTQCFHLEKRSFYCVPLIFNEQLGLQNVELQGKDVCPGTEKESKVSTELTFSLLFCCF